MSKYFTSNYTPLIIIGAGRSGTNILRDCLTEINGFSTWQCDEINPIWRHGNTSKVDDVFGIDDATQYVVDYIQNQFSKIYHLNNAKFVVEKTCANSLRVPFINTIFPNAKFLFIVRDGRDVTASAIKRWSSDFDPKYYAKKLKYVPPSDIPIYALKFVENRLTQLFSKERQLSTWGPIFAGMKNIAKSHSLSEVCAMQWVSCVQASEEAFKNIRPERVFRLTYENFTAHPQREFERIVKWTEIESNIDERVYERLSSVSTKSVGNWRNANLDNETLKIMNSWLSHYGYL